jgi:putative transposase
MSHVFHQLFYHLTWATHARDPLINGEWRPQLLNILVEEIGKRGGRLIRHNAMPDHVHILVRLPPTVVIADFIGEVNGATAFRVNREVRPSFKLKWQEGYGILTLRKSEVAAVSQYIDNQELHHRNGRLSRVLETSEVDRDDWESPLKEAGRVNVNLPQA